MRPAARSEEDSEIKYKFRDIISILNFYSIPAESRVSQNSLPINFDNFMGVRKFLFDQFI